MLRMILVLFAALLVATGPEARTLEHRGTTLTLGYDQMPTRSGARLDHSIRGPSFGLSSLLRAGPVSLEGELRRRDQTLRDYRLRTRWIDLHGRYDIGPALSAGVYLTRLRFRNTRTQGRFVAEGVSLRHRTAYLEIEGILGRVDTGESGGHAREQGLRAEIALGPRSWLGIGANRMRQDATRTLPGLGPVTVRASFRTVSLYAGHAFESGLSVFAAAQETRFDPGSGKATSLVLGLSQEWRLGGQPVILSAEAGRSRLRGHSARGDTLRLGMTLPFGQEATRTSRNGTLAALRRRPSFAFGPLDNMLLVMR